jgi:polyhydroxybutyrate depolymerase
MRSCNRRHLHIHLGLRPIAATVATLATLLGLGACASLSVLPARSRDVELKVGREQRDYILHVPRSYDRGTAAPLVVLLHGHGSRAQTFERLTGMSGKADHNGFIVAYPQALGSPSVWHSGVDGSARIDDVAFIRTLIDSIRAAYNIDPDRIYVAGHSNGAFMAYRVGVVLSSTVAAIGISAGSIGRITSRGDTVRVQAPPQPVSLIAFHGLADNMVPYDGGAETDGPRRIVSAPASIRFWAIADGCSMAPDTTVLERGNVVRADFTGCRAATEVVFYTISDGTHKWAGDRTPWWKFWEHTNNSLSATDEMWAFFKAHPKVKRDSLAATP